MLKPILSFLFLILAFLAGSAFLHQLVILLEITGLGAFLIYCIPFFMVLSFTTKNDNENYWVTLFRNGFWGYSFILSVAGVAWIIGKMSDGS